MWLLFYSSACGYRNGSRIFNKGGSRGKHLICVCVKQTPCKSAPWLYSFHQPLLPWTCLYNNQHQVARWSRLISYELPTDLTFNKGTIDWIPTTVWSDKKFSSPNQWEKEWIRGQKQISAGNEVLTNRQMAAGEARFVKQIHEAYHSPHSLGGASKQIGPHCGFRFGSHDLDIETTLFFNQIST